MEDHALLRAGMCSLISANPRLQVLADVSNARDAIHTLRSIEPDLILMDISMPGISGIEAVIDIKRRYPKIRIMIVTIHRADEYIHASLQAGADGYLLKDASNEELQSAIRCVLAGNIYLSPDVSGKVVKHYLIGGSSQAELPFQKLTHRERQILRMVAEGNTSRFIAEYLSLSTKTVEKHRSNLMQKLGLHNASSLTAYAIENGLLGQE